jgi:hypothetical protein
MLRSKSSRAWLAVFGTLGWLVCGGALAHGLAGDDQAVIGLSVVYKAFENLGGFTALGVQPNMKAAVLFFGFFHGFGLATKLQDLAISRDGLVANMLSFNVGVEIGQLLALSVMLIVFNAWRTTGSFTKHAYAANVALLTVGFVLFGYQLTGYSVA